MPVPALTDRLALLTLAVFVVAACSPTAEEVASTPAASTAPKATVAPAQERFNLHDAIAKHRKLLRQAPGRTGILKEESKYSLFDEELIIRDFFQDRRDGFFVDVGCAWPIRANNTYYLEKHLGWTGVGVDALPDYAPMWEDERPISKFFNFLVTDRSGTKESFFRSESLGLSSTSAHRADGKHFGGELAVEEVKISSITLNDLLDRVGATKVDLLSMDIEGHELTALRGFDIDRFQPDLVVTEGRRPGVEAYFKDHGYERIERYLPFDLANVYYRRVE